MNLIGRRFSRDSVLECGSPLPLFRQPFAETEDKDSRVVHFTPVGKAPEDWRGPRPGGIPGRLGDRKASFP